MKRRYYKKHTQEEAKNLIKQILKSAPSAHHQASLAWTPPPIYTAVPTQEEASTSQTHMENEPAVRYRQQARYNFLVPESAREPHLAMPAGATIGDGLPDISNLW
jgi:hypothetical protein